MSQQNSLITPSLQEASFDRNQKPLQGHLLVTAQQAIQLSGITLELEKVFPGKGREVVGTYSIESHITFAAETSHEFSFLFDYEMLAEQVFDLFGMKGSLKAKTESIGSALGHIASDFYVQVSFSGTCKGESFSETHRLLVRIF